MLRNRRQGLRVGIGSHDVANGNASLCLLERELAHVREDERKLLLVIRPQRCLRRALYEHDAKRGWILFGECTELFSQLVIWNIQPSAVRGIRLAIC